MKRIHVVLILGVVLLGCALALAAYIRLHGFSARTPPSSFEAFVARRLRALAVPARARAAVNPVPAGPQVLSEAMAHFADHCAICHGNDGSGDTMIGRGLSPRPPDMRGPDTQGLSDGELYYVIHNGLRLTGMPAFGEDKPGETDRGSWKLVHFIRRLPRITAEDLQSMKRLNPRSPAELEEEERIRRFLAGEDVPPPETTSHQH